METNTNILNNANENKSIVFDDKQVIYTAEQKKKIGLILAPRTQEVMDARIKRHESKAYAYFSRKRTINIIIWLCLLIEPIINLLSFIIVYFSTESDKDQGLANFVGWVGIWVSLSLLIAYAVALIPILLSIRVWTYTYKGSLIIVYLGVIRCMLTIDEKLHDKKPKKLSTYLYGVLPDGQQLEVHKNGIICSISTSSLQKPVVPII